jgi:hypothetical protein
MSNQTTPVSYITITGLPDIQSRFPENKTINILNDFQQQHYTDHSTIYSVINNLHKSLNMPQIQVPIPNLFFNDAPSFNIFLTNNRTDHALFYQATTQIAQELVTKGYGVTPTLINFNENLIQSTNEYDYLTIDKFMRQEVSIHNAFMRYLEILIDTLNKTPIPLAGGS